MLMLSERLLQLANDEGTAQIHDVALEFAHLVVKSTLRPISDARRDGTPILIKLKDHIPVASMQRWQGLTFVGCLLEPYDFAWRFAAPIGQGGFRDEWIEGWWSLAQFRAA